MNNNHPPNCPCGACADMRWRKKNGHTSKGDRKQIKTYYTRKEHAYMAELADQKGITPSSMQGVIVREAIAQGIAKFEFVAPEVSPEGEAEKPKAKAKAKSKAKKKAKKAKAKAKAKT